MVSLGRWPVFLQSQPLPAPWPVSTQMGKLVQGRGVGKIPLTHLQTSDLMPPYAASTGMRANLVSSCVSGTLQCLSISIVGLAQSSDLFIMSTLLGLWIYEDISHRRHHWISSAWTALTVSLWTATPRKTTLQMHKSLQMQPYQGSVGPGQGGYWVTRVCFWRRLF